MDRYSAHPLTRVVGVVTWKRCRFHDLPGDGGRRGRDQCGQATKGMWGMSWRRQAMKGVEDCDKSGGAVKRALMPEFPNQCILNT